MVRNTLANIAVVFPGQGAQRVGMLSAYRGFAAVAEAVAEASEAIGEDLARLIEYDEAGLNQTVNTQPAMLAVGVGVYRAVAHYLPAPLCFGGHSLGEYSALVAAKALSLADAARLVYRRATLMQTALAGSSAGEGGGMAAVLGLNSLAVETLCATLRQQNQLVWPANYNSDKQIVIAGYHSAVTKAMAAAKKAGAKRCVMLPMSVPSHCPLLAPAAEELLADLAAVRWQPPTAPILHSATVERADSFTAGENGSQLPLIVRRLAAQLVQPIYWQQLLAQAAGYGVQTVIESGPGNVLTNLGKKSNLTHLALHDASALKALMQ